jgi:hypothetical protein
MDKSYYQIDDILYKENSKYFTSVIPINDKINILYDFDYQNNINKNAKNIYKQTKNLINILLKYLVILKKNNLSFKNTDKEQLLFKNDLLKINQNNILEYILFNLYYELDSYMNSVYNLVQIVIKNNLYLEKNIDIKEIKINLMKKNIKKYYLKNFDKSNLDTNYNYSKNELINISFMEPSLITKELIETKVLYDYKYIII